MFRAHDLPESEVRAARKKDRPLRWQAQHSYGKREPTEWELQLTDKRWRRVFADHEAKCRFVNVGCGELRVDHIDLTKHVRGAP